MNATNDSGRLRLPWKLKDDIAASAEDEALYRAHQLDVGTWSWRWFCLASAIVAGVWWPLDFVVFRRVPQAIEPLAVWRIVSIVLCVAVFVLQPRLALFRRHPYAILGSGALVVCVVATYEAGRIGGPSSPWFMFTPFLTLAPIAVALSLRERVIVTFAFAICLVIGFFILHPDHLGDPMALATLSFFVFIVFSSIALGVGADRLRRSTFLLRRATERQAGELREWNDRLEGMVREQTDELRMLSAHRESVRETERAHIARELHDELGQELTALRYSLELLRVRYRQQPDSVERNINELEKLMSRTRGTIRSILTELRPIVLDHLGFVAAARWLVERTEERAGFKCHLDVPAEELAVPEATSVGAFRILQESLTNISRHAQAREVRICVRPVDGSLEVRVEDDGVGFEPTRSSGGLAGMGLVGMRERARDLMGTLEIDSAPGRGTRLVTRLPLQKPEAA